MKIYKDQMKGPTICLPYEENLEMKRISSEGADFIKYDMQLQVYRFTRDGASIEDIAAVLDIDSKTLSQRYSEEISRGRAERRILLRRWQFREAEKGSVPMLIFLGKQELGQSENPNNERQNSAVLHVHIKEIP